MDAASYILQRQALWARRRGLSLQGSEGLRGREAYAQTLEENLFEPLCEEARRELEQGDGGALKGKGNQVPRILALHSTEALACNIFHYWKRLGQIGPVVQAMRLPEVGVEAIRFEAKLPIAPEVNRRQFPRNPNIDVAIRYASNSRLREVGIECKFTEIFRKHHGLKPAYLEQVPLWQELLNCRKLAEQISPDDDQFEYLHAAQLLKHILALKNAHTIRGFRLAYLWYDVLGDAGTKHRQEIEKFSQIVRQDGITFQAVTFQAMILHLAHKQREKHQAYIDYMSERYL